MTAVVLLAGLACDIPRDNPLDPKNPDASRPKNVLIEAFVNLHNGLPYDGYMIDALDSLEAQYTDRIIIVEYHRNVPNSQTPYHRAENEILYEKYINVFPSSQKGVPDVFINGTEGRIQGASSVASAFYRLQEAVLSRASCLSQFFVQIETVTTGNQVTPKIIIAKLGKSDSENLLIKSILISRISLPYYGRVVTSDAKRTLIPRLHGGETQTIQLPAMQADFSVPTELVVILTDQDERMVMQCEKKQVNP